MIGDPEPDQVYLVDADAPTRASLRRLLQPLAYPIAEYGSAEDFLAAADLHAAGCLLVDVDLPGISGITLHARLRAAVSAIAVVFITANTDVATAVECMRHGAITYLMKPAREQQLLDVVNRALRKSKVAATRAKAERTVLNLLARLTAREREVLVRLADGMPHEDISRELGIAKRTVEAHRRRIMEKMGARTVPHLLHQLAHVGWPEKPIGHHPAAR